MSLYALVSPGGAPGVTTTAIALALTWPRPAVVAECDPAGGSILAGLYAGHLPAPRGLLGLAFEAGRGGGPLSAGPGGQIAPLDGGGSAMFLPGLSDPRQAPGLAPAWPAIARALAGQPGDVIADCGRLDAGDGQPASVLAVAEVVGVVMRATLRQVAAARPRIEMLAQLRAGPTGLVLIGERGHSPAEVSKALGLPVLASLPADARTAAVLSDGVRRRASLDGKPLLRAARIAGQALVRVAREAAQPGLAAAVPGVLS